MKKGEAQKHPDYTEHLKRLSRVRGQVDGIDKMIRDRRYCPEIIIQIRAASKALQGIEREILKKHVQGCVKSAIKSRDEKDVSDKIDEILGLMKSL